MHKLRLIILTPILLILSATAIFIGLFSFGGINFSPTQLQIDNSALAQITLLLLRCAIIPFQLLFIMLLFIGAFSIHRVRDTLANSLLRGPIMQKWVLKPSEMVTEKTLHRPTTDQPIDTFMGRTTAVQVTGSAISFTAYTIAFVLSLGQFLSLESLGLLVTVITGGISWGARTLIGDLLGGMSNIAEDNFSVGDRVSIFYANTRIEGIVESVTVRIINLRAATGELYVIPHGELRVLHNYSRGEFGGTYVEIYVASQDLERTIELLEANAADAVSAVADLFEPWQIIARTGNVSQVTSISLFCKAQPGQEQTLRLEAMSYVAEMLSAEAITLGATGGTP